jgi:hypothetical protein
LFGYDQHLAYLPMLLDGSSTVSRRTVAKASPGHVPQPFLISKQGQMYGKINSPPFLWTLLAFFFAAKREKS